MIVLCFFFTTEEILLKNQLESLNFLTRVKNQNKVDVKQVFAKRGDNVSFFVCVLWVLRVCDCFIQIWTKNTLSFGSSSNYAKQRDECIKHAKNADGNIITATDPKVAVTDNFLCTGGRSPQRDHIACTGIFPLLHVYNIADIV